MALETIVLSVSATIILGQFGIIGFFLKGKMKKIDDIEHNYVTRLDAIKEDVTEVKEKVNQLYIEHKILTRGGNSPCVISK